jgi:hypothetical protein
VSYMPFANGTRYVLPLTRRPFVMPAVYHTTRQPTPEAYVVPPDPAIVVVLPAVHAPTSVPVAGSSSSPELGITIAVPVGIPLRTAFQNVSSAVFRVPADPSKT